MGLLFGAPRAQASDCDDELDFQLGNKHRIQFLAVARVGLAWILIFQQRNMLSYLARSKEQAIKTNKQLKHLLFKFDFGI